jgi:acetylornithine deacetylase/succinyl-diaminopimelate desuccinylase-like protein
MRSPTQPLAFARARSTRFNRELVDFVRFPTISAQPRHAADMKRCARWLADHLKSIGFEQSSVLRTPGHPLVYAEWCRHPKLPTVLVYGHYDVQPADPLDEWKSPPFSPVIRGQNLFGRGACDDKGQMFAHVKALESWFRAPGGLPVNVRCVFEGEEEIGSRNLKPFLLENRDKLGANVAVMSDMPILGPDRPAITYSMRGSLGLELELQGPRRDLHSGIYGGAVHNPAQALCEIIAALHDSDGRVAIPGFYDRVRQWSPGEREYMARVGPRDMQILRDAGASRAWGERDYTLYERTTIRPALTVNGITGGYQGPGGKGVIPARATAKLSFRLAHDQEPAEIERLFREHIARIVPATIEWHVRRQSLARPSLVDRNHPAMRAAAFAYRRGFGAHPVFIRSGGTIPVVNLLQETLGIPTVLMGFALPDDRMHAPNEKFHLPNFHRGIATSIWFLAAAGAAQNALTGLPRVRRAAASR